MYMAYGWPQVIPLEQGQCPSSQKIIYFKVINRLLLVVSPSHLELWSSSQVYFYFIFLFMCMCVFLVNCLFYVICDVGSPVFALYFDEYLWVLEIDVGVKEI